MCCLLPICTPRRVQFCFFRQVSAEAKLLFVGCCFFDGSMVLARKRQQAVLLSSRSPAGKRGPCRRCCEVNLTRWWKGAKRPVSGCTEELGSLSCSFAARRPPAVVSTESRCGPSHRDLTGGGSGRGTGGVGSATAHNQRCPVQRKPAGRSVTEAITASVRGVHTRATRGVLLRVCTVAPKGELSDG